MSLTFINVTYAFIPYFSSIFRYIFRAKSWNKKNCGIDYDSQESTSSDDEFYGVRGKTGEWVVKKKHLRSRPKREPNPPGYWARKVDEGGDPGRGEVREVEGKGVVGVSEHGKEGTEGGEVGKELEEKKSFWRFCNIS